MVKLIEDPLIVTTLFVNALFVAVPCVEALFSERAVAGEGFRAVRYPR